MLRLFKFIGVLWYADERGWPEKDEVMKQTVNTERYVEMVRTLGIEEAYKQRFRGTGRTVRDILTLVMNLSHGNKVLLKSSSAPGQSYEIHRYVLEQVLLTSLTLNMAVVRRGDYLEFPDSGGAIKLITESTNTRGMRHDEYGEYRLHDC